MVTAAFSYNSRTALLVVDLQNDFADPRGSLYVRGANELIDKANAYVRLAKEAGAMIAYTQDWHPADTPYFAQDGGIWPVHCVIDSWGAQLVPTLIVDGVVFRKGNGRGGRLSEFSVRDVGTGETRSTEFGGRTLHELDFVRSPSAGSPPTTASKRPYRRDELGYEVVGADRCHPRLSSASGRWRPSTAVDATSRDPVSLTHGSRRDRASAN